MRSGVALVLDTVMKRTALGPLLGLAIFGTLASALAQAPAGSMRPGKPVGPHAGPGGSSGHPPRMLGSAAPGASGARPDGSAHPGLERMMHERLVTLKARRDAHRKELHNRFSELHLKSEALRNELRRHARSVAFLTRARLIAEQELTEPRKAKVLKRIEVLLAKEQARHDRHVAKFTTGPVPSGSAPPFASGVVPPRAPSAMAAPPGSGAAHHPHPKPAASAGGAP